MELQLFALNDSNEFARRISEHLQIPLSPHEEKSFLDGEHKLRPLENVRNRDVFVISSQNSESQISVNDKLCRLLFFISALKDSHAKSVTAVIPYFAYSRSTRKTKDRDPLTMKYLARLLEASGVDHILVMDIHDVAAFQNAFRVPTDHLEARILFAPVLKREIDKDSAVIVATDPGGLNRAHAYCEALGKLTGRDLNFTFMKRDKFYDGEIENKVAIIVEDIIGSGKRILRAVETLSQAGAKKILACATHADLTGAWQECIEHPALSRVYVTDTIPLRSLSHEGPLSKLQIVDSTFLFAKAMKRIQSGDSVVDLIHHYVSSATELRMLS